MFTQSDLKTEKNNVNLHLKLHIVHDIPHCKFYLKNNTHSSLSGKSEETMMVSSLPQKACLQYKTPWPATHFLLFHSCKFIVVDCKQGQLQCPRQALKGQENFTFDKVNGWSNCNSDWKNENSLFKRRFCGHTVVVS